MHATVSKTALIQQITLNLSHTLIQQIYLNRKIRIFTQQISLNRKIWTLTISFDSTNLTQSQDPDIHYFPRFNKSHSIARSGYSQFPLIQQISLTRKIQIFTIFPWFNKSHSNGKIWIFTIFPWFNKSHSNGKIQIFIIFPWFNKSLTCKIQIFTIFPWFNKSHSRSGYSTWTALSPHQIWSHFVLQCWGTWSQQLVLCADLVMPSQGQVYRSSIKWEKSMVPVSMAGMKELVEILTFMTCRTDGWAASGRNTDDYIDPCY